MKQAWIGPCENVGNLHFGPLGYITKAIGNPNTEVEMIDANFFCSEVDLGSFLGLPIKFIRVLHWKYLLKSRKRHLDKSKESDATMEERN